MAVRSTWKGYLKVSLVNIPIRVFPATESAATLSFNQLHAECQTRIQQKRAPSATARCRKARSPRATSSPRGGTW
jgi:non-homologous end joining protein Ku